MVTVFFLGVCCLLFFCVVHEVTVLVKKFESTIVKNTSCLGFVVSHRWFDGFETFIRIVGFSIENKMADLNSVTPIPTRLQDTTGSFSPLAPEFFFPSRDSILNLPIRHATRISCLLRAKLFSCSLWYSTRM